MEGIKTVREYYEDSYRVSRGWLIFWISVLPRIRWRKFCHPAQKTMESCTLSSWRKPYFILREVGSLLIKDIFWQMDLSLKFRKSGLRVTPFFLTESSVRTRPLRLVRKLKKWLTSSSGKRMLAFTQPGISSTWPWSGREGTNLNQARDIISRMDPMLSTSVWCLKRRDKNWWTFSISTVLTLSRRQKKRVLRSIKRSVLTKKQTRNSKVLGVAHPTSRREQRWES